MGHTWMSKITGLASSKRAIDLRSLYNFFIILERTAKEGGQEGKLNW
jgi:hypothetical protein